MKPEFLVNGRPAQVDSWNLLRTPKGILQYPSPFRREYLISIDGDVPRDMDTIEIRGEKFVIRLADIRYSTGNKWIAQFYSISVRKEE